MNESGLVPENDDEILYNLEEISAKNNIIHVARELDLNVNRSTIPCINRKNHRDQSGYPTMTFNPLKNTFKCWVCKDVGGDVIDLVMQVKGISRKEAIEYLAIRAEIEPNGTNKRRVTRRYMPDKETIFRDVNKGIYSNGGVDLLAFVSLKGGTGKSLIINNLAFSFAILSRFIADYQKKEMQKVELIDLDFGKPDQRLIIGVEPKYYIEDILYNRDDNISWDEVKQSTTLDGLSLISSSPVRRTQNLFYFHKNEIIYLINNSDAKIKLADFGGGVNKDILDFLHNIYTKIFVITSEETSRHAVFNLILTMLYNELRNVFQKDKYAFAYLEKFRDCSRTGFRVDDLRFEFEKLDERKERNGSIEKFYIKEILPVKEELGLPPKIFGNVGLSELRGEITELKEKILGLMFNSHNGNSISYSKKLAMYKRLNKILIDSEKLDTYLNRLDSVLKSSKYGLIVNKTDRERAWEIQNEVSEKIQHSLGEKIVYLGNLRESKTLSNISDYGMPYVIYNHEDEALEDIYNIGDNLLGLKRGSISEVICSQKDFIRDVRNNWKERQNIFN